MDQLQDAVNNSIAGGLTWGEVFDRVFTYASGQDEGCHYVEAPTVMEAMAAVRRAINDLMDAEERTGRMDRG